MSNETSSVVPQSGVVAFRVQDGVLEALLVRPSDDQPEWVFPKGHIEPNELRHQAALRELREEAGVTGALIGAVEQTSRFRSKNEDVEVRFFVVEALKFGAPTETRDHLWLPMALAAEALTHAHNRIILSEALPIIESHLSRLGKGDKAFGEFLLLELSHTTESLLKSEEDGERRAKFFLALVAGAGAVLAFMLGDGSRYKTDEISWPLVLVLAALLAMGIFVLKRLLTRNRKSDEYIDHLARLRRWFTPTSLDPRRPWAAFDPYKPKPKRDLSYWGPKKGGWVEVLLLVLAILGGALTGAVINTSSWDIEALVTTCGGAAAWFLLVAWAKRRLTD